jgi:chemotaxis-related protein WspD
VKSLHNQREAPAARFLDRTVPEDYLRERTELVATPKIKSEVGTKSVVIFRIGTEWLALATHIFQEVAEPRTVRPLPDSRRGLLLGLINVRGELLLCIGLEALLAIQGDRALQPPRKSTSPAPLLICNHPDGRLAFPVCEVAGVHHYSPNNLTGLPPTLSKLAAGNYITAIIPWQDKSVGLLDDELMFYALNRDLA